MLKYELVFRLSLYVSKVLEPHSIGDRRRLFAVVKRLYRHRSAAVHGSKMKSEARESVAPSADLLRRLIEACVEVGEVPRTEDLAP